jgi:threonine/homoserine/homoserine lactone efflux protein
MDVIAGVVAPALGVALNPFQIIAIILVLASAQARAGGLAFLAGWSGGILAAVGVLMLLANLGGLRSDEASTLRWVSLFKLAVGVLLLGMAAHKWMARPRAGDEAKLPGWLAAIPEQTPQRLVRLGAMLAALNPKNLMFSVVAATSIASSGASVGGEIGLWLLYIVVASATVLVPVAWYLLSPAGAAPVLDRVNAWLVRHNVTILVLMLLLIGSLLIVNGVEGLR